MTDPQHQPQRRLYRLVNRSWQWVLVWAILATLATIVLPLLTSCGPTPAVRQDPPAAADVADLAAREKAAGIAAAEAAAKGDAPEADYQRRLAAELRPLREAAETRAAAQQRDLEAIAAREAKAARAALAAEQLARDRRWSGIAVGVCVAAAVAMVILGLPPLLAVGLPGACAAGLLWVAAWSSVPWLAWALGLALACALLLGLAALAVYAVQEWRRWADDRDVLGRADADARSLARQPPPLRWLVSRLLGTA